MSITKLLTKIYYDPENTASFSSVEKLYVAARQKKRKITRKDVVEFLQKQEVYTLHHPVKERFKRRKTLAKYKDHIWQIDLIDMSQFSRINHGYKFILTCIDILSRFGFAIPIRNKTGESVISAFQHIFSKFKRKPTKIHSDRGGEFTNHAFQQFLKQEKIIHYYSYSELKAAVVERFNRTLKSKLYKYFTYQKSNQYVKVLPLIVLSYNNTTHSAHGTAPNDVTKRNQKKIWKILYEKYLKTKPGIPKFQVGNNVRISKTRKQFQKGYLQRYTQEVFKIKQIKYSIPVTYQLKDSNDEIIEGFFYEPELIKVTE